MLARHLRRRQHDVATRVPAEPEGFSARLDFDAALFALSIVDMEDERPHFLLPLRFEHHGATTGWLLRFGDLVFRSQMQLVEFTRVLVVGFERFTDPGPTVQTDGIEHAGND